MNDLQKLRIIENDIKGYIAQQQLNNSISNDAMSLILGDILGAYEKARSTDYLIEQMIKEQQEEKKEVGDADS